MSDLIYHRESKKEIYVSLSVYRALWMLAKSQSRRGDHNDTNADATADVILRDRIETLYPSIFEHQKQMAKLESEFLKTLGENDSHA